MTFELQKYLSNRRSVKVMDMMECPEIADNMSELLTIASRTPDHGKLAPWRFINLPFSSRDKFCDLVEQATRQHYSSPSDETIAKEVGLFQKQIGAVILVYSPKDSVKIPQWEQQLACGAVGMNIIHAAHSFGYVAQWLTGWLSFDDVFNQHLNLTQGEKIAGYFFIGKSDVKPEDRPRPNMHEIISNWTGA